MTSSTAKRALRGLVRAALAVPLALPLAAQADYAAELGKLKSAKPNDATLVTLQAGLAAFSENKMPEATRHFDLALDVIEGMFADTESAAKARSLWYAEGAKDFKGEPYERAMAFYYRGLAYLADADYENARASFRSGLLQDAFAEEQQYRADFTSLMLLEGWANQLAGDQAQAQDAYAEVARAKSGWQAPPANANLLVVAELGGSPRKVADGIDNHEIRYFKPKRTPERQLRVQLDGQAVQPVLVEDVYYQASTRGGRAIDSIIAGKASFKQTTADIGMAATNVANELKVYAPAVGSSGRALGGLVAVGAIASMISANVQPRADVRYWNNLPETIHIAALNHGGLPGNVQVSLLDEAGNPVAADKLVINKWIDAKGNMLVWIKSRN